MQIALVSRPLRPVPWHQSQRTGVRANSGGVTSTFIQEARRRRIIDAAIDCLAEDGWHQTTLATIAARAGISRGLISYHFSGREDLYESVVATVYGDGAEQMAERVAAESTAAGRLRVYITENLRYVAEHRRGIAALNQVLPNLRRADGSPRFGAADEEPILTGTAAVFDHGRSTGEFRPVDSRLWAFYLRRCIDGAAYRITTEEDADVTQLAEQLYQLFAGGVLVAAATEQRR